MATCLASRGSRIRNRLILRYLAISPAIAKIAQVNLVLDTDVMVAAIRSNTGASNLLLRAALARRCTPLVSVPLVIEYEAVMSRSEHLAESGLSIGHVGVLIDGLISIARHVRLDFLWRPQLRDPADDMVLETAVNGGARLLVTFNRRDFRLGAARFGVEVCTPRDALQIVEKGR
ncbi:MAG: putative toxin-antitoxin system toxin component, PIN family [Reyranellaceae bacterium]